MFMILPIILPFRAKYVYAIAYNCNAMAENSHLITIVSNSIKI